MILRIFSLSLLAYSKYMHSEHEPQQNHSIPDLLFSTTTGILYGLGIALVFLLLFAFSIDSKMLASLTTIFFGSSI